MSGAVAVILGQLTAVETERAYRRESKSLQGAVDDIKRFQQRRFAHTYSDIAASARYGPAIQFFVDELYGPRDFTRRDKDLARVVPAMAKLFPEPVLATVGMLVDLHALSERLDTLMGVALGRQPLRAPTYVRIWQKTGRELERRRQLDMILSVGRSLDILTKKPLLRRSLRLMRGPAKLAGLMSLQRTLESGFDAFVAMGGVGDFLGLISNRESRLIEGLFSASALDNQAELLGP